MFLKKRGFTLAEIVTTVVIITAIITISMAYFGAARRMGRDTRRVTDIKNIQAALENYHRQEGSYPDQIIIGGSIYSSSSNVTYMTSVPSNPTPRNEGDCLDNDYFYQKNTTYDNYFLTFCLAEKNGSYSKGLNIESSDGIINKEEVVDGAKLNQGLVAYWKMDEYFSTVAADSSSNSQSFTFGEPGQRWESDNFGYSIHIHKSALNFGDYNVMDFTNAFSVSTWIYIKGDVDPTDLPIVSKYDPASGWDFGINNSKLEIGLRGSPENYHLASSGPAVNGWHQVAAVNTLYSSKIYLDGTLISTKNGTWGPIANSSNFLIGGRNNGPTDLNADLSDLRIYNRALSDAEIAWLYLFKKP